MKTALPISTLAATLSAMVLAGSAHAVDPYKDLSIKRQLSVEQRAIVDIAPQPRATTAAASGRAVALTTTLDRPNGKYKPGETVALTVKSGEDAYIWVFDTGTSGRVHQLFPNKYAKDNFVRANSPLTLPGAGAKYRFVVSQPEGVELLTVIASRDNKPLTGDLIDRETGAGPFLALQGTAVSVSKDLMIAIDRDHPKSAVSHQAFRIVE